MSPARLLHAQATTLRTHAQAILAQADALDALAQAPLEAAPPAPSTPYLSIAQLCAKHPAFCAKTVRKWVTARGVNGLDAVVCEVGTKGGKLLIDEAAFLTWVGQHKKPARHLKHSNTRRA